MPNCSIHFPDAHPSTQGHFAGNPIIPGALLLAEVLRAVQIAMPQCTQFSLKTAKFTHPVCPGEIVHIDCSSHANEIKFHCATEQSAVLSGSFKCQPATTPD